MLTTMAIATKTKMRGTVGILGARGPRSKGARDGSLLPGREDGWTSLATRPAQLVCLVTWLGSSCPDDSSPRRATVLSRTAFSGPVGVQNSDLSCRHPVVLVDQLATRS